MNSGTFLYQARCVGIVDGDTLDLEVDLGFNIKKKIRVRLVGIDTHEIYGVDHDSDEYKKGIEEKRFVMSWMDNNPHTKDTWPLVVETQEDDKGKFGRYLAKVYSKRSGENLAKELIKKFDDVEDT